MESSWELWVEYFQVGCFQVVGRNFLSVACVTDWGPLYGLHVNGSVYK